MGALTNRWTTYWYTLWLRTQGQAIIHRGEKRNLPLIFVEIIGARNIFLPSVKISHRD